MPDPRERLKKMLSPSRLSLRLRRALPRAAAGGDEVMIVYSGLTVLPPWGTAPGGGAPDVWCSWCGASGGAARPPSEGRPTGGAGVRPGSG
ncbi:hypothetical protein GCM10009663_14010 [Kitasatospora arboriphila]|uniref:Uncharacterized protein n=1 Tax=Kitasatospora arboriphila TaxID=258052 RepID=A0ABN1TCI2_9ACTN